MNGDAEVIAALRERGDPIEVARPVRHWAYFSSREGAELYRNWLLAIDFKVVTVEDEPERGDLTWSLKYEHVGVPTLETLTAHTDLAAAKAQLFGGAYDGWETSVEPP